MAFQRNNYTDNSQGSALAPAQRALDVVASANPLPFVTRGVMVSDACTITGTFTKGQEGASHTTFELVPGMLYPFMFATITAISNGASVKGYA